MTNQFNERHTGIIVTLPKVFLIELANKVLDRFYQHPWNEKKGSQVVHWYRKRLFTDRTAKYPTTLRNTNKAIIELGLIECIRQIEQMKDNEKFYWQHSMGKKPANVKDLLYCYVNVCSKIRYRFKILRFAKGGTRKFSDNRKWTANHWLEMNLPVKIDPEIKMGGFQGFRYWKDNYDC